MNDRQKRFVAEYLIDLNATQAAIRAGYSEKAAAAQASRLLTNAKISAAVAKGKAAMASKLDITAERVIAELAKIGFSNMADYITVGSNGDPFVDLSNLDRDKSAAIQEITVDDYVDGRGEDARDVKRVKFKLADKRAALVDLGKHLGLFVDRQEVSGPGGGPLEITKIERVIVRPPDRNG